MSHIRVHTLRSSKSKAKICCNVLLLHLSHKHLHLLCWNKLKWKSALLQCAPTRLLQSSQTVQFAPKCYVAHIGWQVCINSDDLISALTYWPQHKVITTKEKWLCLWLSTWMAWLNGFWNVCKWTKGPSEFFFFLWFVSLFCFCLSVSAFCQVCDLGMDWVKYRTHSEALGMRIQKLHSQMTISR